VNICDEIMSTFLPFGTPYRYSKLISVDFSTFDHKIYYITKVFEHTALKKLVYDS